MKCNMFCALTLYCDVLGRFHCWVVNERAFVFTGVVTRDIRDGIGICIFHFHQLSLQRQSNNGSRLVYDALLKKRNIIRFQMQSECVYLEVEVKAGRCGVTICHTLQSHIVSFY